MRKVLLLCAALFAMAAGAQQTPRWLRNSAISPDGRSIAFTYMGDIFTVDATGGSARQITSHDAYDTQPVWSPDSKQIAFASTRNGSMDIYIVSKDGGVPKRLTTHSTSEKPVAFLNSKEILYVAAMMRATRGCAQASS